MAGARRQPAQAPPVFREIGFLLAHGVPAETLSTAVAAAALGGVSASEAILRLGLVSEDAFYRALARELGLRFEAKPRLGRGTRFPESLLAGAAPSVFRGRLVAAPAGEQVARLLKGRARFGDLAITTPSALRESVFALIPGRIAATAAQSLPAADPDLSARDGLTCWQLGALAALAGALAFAGGLFPHETGSVLLGALSLLFFVMVGLRCAAALVPEAAREPVAEVPDSALPTYTVVVALYREARVVPKLLWALGRLDYPAVKLDIKFVLEAGDDETRSALEREGIPAHAEILVAPPGVPRTKPRALNVALSLARGRYTVVYDAEDEPEPDQLRRAVAAFAVAEPEVACLQARLAIDNTDDSWVTRFFTLEYAALFDVINPGLARLRLPIPLGGTSNHFRTGVLRRIGGWDAWNVTEDADLGIRLARLGYRTADLPSTTVEEAPKTLAAWLRQRSRWIKGLVQTCATHARHPVSAFRELGAFGFAGAVTMTFGTVLSAIGYPAFLLATLVRVALVGAEVPTTASSVLLAYGSAALFALGFVAMVLPAALGAERRGLQDLRWLVPLMPLYYVLAGVAALRAFRELATDPFRWDKTEHGLARTSRTGAAPSLPKDAPAYERASQSFAASSGARFTLKLPTNRFFPSIR